MAWKTGSQGNDWLVGTNDGDTMKGLGGNDTLKGGGGADWIDGGAGIDSAIYADSSVGVTIDLWGGRGKGGTAEGDTLINVENIYGSGYNDFLFGNDAANELRGLDGNDQLVGHGGNDWLDGGYGDDMMSGGTGADIIDGGAGFDTAYYAASSTGVSIALDNGSTGYGGDADGDWLVNIEGLQGSSHDDALWGNDVHNEIDGLWGNDELKGGGGDDWLMGNFGNDRLYGGTGDDWIAGGQGEDRIEGGAGADDMFGEAGADRFVWTAVADSGMTAATSDTIFDFNFADGDRIDVSGIDANRYATGDQAFRFIGTADFTWGRPGEINYVHDDGMTIIQLNTGRFGHVEALIQLSGTVTPEASWFVL